MALDKNKQYLVLNYNSSPVAIATRHDSFIVKGGTSDGAGSLPLTLEEIMQVNNNSVVFKYGVLWFEKDYEDEIYNYLRIKDYKNILTDDEIRDILVNPTPDGLKKILSISNDTYFNRVRGIHIGLKNSTDIPSRIDRMIDERYREIMAKKATTSIVISANTKPEKGKNDPDEVAAMRNEIAELKALIMAMTKPTTDTASDDTPANEKPKAKSKSSVMNKE